MSYLTEQLDGEIDLEKEIKLYSFLEKREADQLNFIKRILIKAKTYYRRQGSLKNIHEYISTDFTFYGGENFFLNKKLFVEYIITYLGKEYELFD